MKYFKHAVDIRSM